jgi:hypothetical protein
MADAGLSSDPRGLQKAYAQDRSRKNTRGAGRSRHSHPSATDDINVVEPKVDSQRNNFVLLTSEKSDGSGKVQH